MLRITSGERDGFRILRLEGKLTGAWVDELRRCWSNTGCGALRIELEDVGFVDRAGRALLAEMHSAGVEIAARGCLANSLRDEIVAASKSS